MERTGHNIRDKWWTISKNEDKEIKDGPKWSLANIVNILRTIESIYKVNILQNYDF